MDAVQEITAVVLVTAPLVTPVGTLGAVVSGITGAHGLAAFAVTTPSLIVVIPVPSVKSPPPLLSQAPDPLLNAAFNQVAVPRLMLLAAQFVQAVSFMATPGAAVHAERVIW